MTYLYPCRGCPLREGCEQRDELRAKVKGLGLKRAEISCPKLKAELRPGRRIVVTKPVPVLRDREVVRYDRVPVTATITHTRPMDKSLHFRCVVDPGESEDKFRWRRPRPHRNIVRFLDEPDRKICQCGFVIYEGAADKGSRDDGSSCVDLIGDETAVKVARKLGVVTCQTPQPF